MNIQQQNGIVSTINFANFSETEEFGDLRKTLFHQASIASNIVPLNRIDAFDETILVFESFFQALNFLCHVFRAVVNMEHQTNDKISLRSSLCYGDFFVHQDQIYGDAVNLATKLSYTSRENELLVCGIESSVVNEFINSQNDIICFIRNQKENCVSIGLYDQESTQSTIDTSELKVDFNGQTRKFSSGRSQKVQIGRSEQSDIFIDSHRISRNHATITMNFDHIFIEDHSANGTFVNFDDREIFLTNEKLKLSSLGQISCGISLSTSKKVKNIISYSLKENTKPRRLGLLNS